MTTTTDTILIRTKPARRTAARWTAVTLAGATAVLLAVARHDDADPALSRLSVPTRTPDGLPRSADAAERWLTGASIDVRGLSPDAAERWLTTP